MTSWLWILLGIGLLAAEMLTPGGFFVLFFGIAALLVGALVGIGIAGPPAVQWLLFSVLSVASLLLFRRELPVHLRRSLTWDRGKEILS